MRANDRPRRLLLRDILALPMQPQRAVVQGNLLVEDGRVAYLGPAEPPAEESVDLQGAVVIPGLVQLHVHLCQTLLRGSAEHRPLLSWLEEVVWPLESSMDAQDVYLSALLGCAELLSGGTTAVLDMGPCRHADAVFEACLAAGIRATSGNSLMDSDEAARAGLAVSPRDVRPIADHLIDRWHGAAGGRLRYCYAPRFPLGCSVDLLSEVSCGARDRSVVIHTHLAETEDEERAVIARFGTSGAEHLATAGVIGPRTVLAHCVHTGPAEWELLAKSRAVVAHCPSSNLKLGSGVAPVAEFLNRGIRVGIGADGAPCNNRLDAFEEMRQCALIASLRSGPDSVSAWDVLRMATTAGARALREEGDLGTLEVGKKADIIAVDLSGYHCRPGVWSDPATALVFSARAADVVLTMVEGDVVYTRERGLLNRLDRELNAADQHARQLRERIASVGERT
jgi:5-methylthioadenosine/S-adenosylhomocysteine deaminase